MLKRILKITSLSAVLTAMLWSVGSCKEDESFVDRSVNIKDEYFRQNVKAKTVGGNKATVINSKAELKESVGELADTDPTLMGINFDNSTFILDSDTLIYVIPTNLPNIINSYLMRGLSGNYSFSYSIETQKAETDDPEDDKIKNAKRDFIIGIIVDKLPEGSDVYLDKNINFIDSTVHGYPSKIGKIKRYR